MAMRREMNSRTVTIYLLAVFVISYSVAINNNDIQFISVHNVPALPGYVLAEPSSFGPQVRLNIRRINCFLVVLTCALHVRSQYTESRLVNVSLVLAEVILDFCLPTPQRDVVS